MLKRIFMVLMVLGLCVVPAVGSAAEYTQDQILQELERLKQTVKAQQEHINRLESIIEQSLDKKIDAKIEEKIATEKKAAVTLGNTFIDQLDIKGDLRIRYERRDRKEPTTSSAADKARDRFLTRFRIGGVWKNKDENWEVGAGLCTGGNAGTSTNDTWGEEAPFETGDIRIDYAYAKHKTDNVAITLGQQKNPFVCSWLIWDSDLRPTGLTGQYASDLGLFVTLGGYGVILYDDDNTAMMYAGQAGYNHTFGDVRLTTAVGYQHYDSIFSSAEAPNPDYDFQIGDIILMAEIPVNGVNLSPYAQVWNNFGADGVAGTGQRGGNLEPEDEDIGWVAGLTAKMGAIKCGYAYAVVGADSIYGGLTDATFGSGVGGTDLKGHKLDISYGFTKNISAALTVMLYEAAELENQREADMYQFDLNYKF